MTLVLHTASAADVRAVRFLAEASGFVQPCLATLRLSGSATSYSFDVHIVRETALPQLRTFSFSHSPFVEGLVFIAILVVALAYVWRKGDLEWVRAEDRS